MICVKINRNDSTKIDSRNQDTQQFSIRMCQMDTMRILYTQLHIQIYGSVSTFQYGRQIKNNCN